MRTIYLMRHAQPQFENGRRCCLGQKTDPPLSIEGREQALALRDCFNPDTVTGVYASRLQRSVETARILAADRWNVTVLPGIEELDCGEWEGKTFAEIQQEYPLLYAKRKQDMSLPPPGGECFESAAARALTVLRHLLDHSHGDIAVVAHAGVNRAILCSLMNIPMKDNRTLDQPYGCINILVEHQGNLDVMAVARPADSPLFTQSIAAHAV